MLARFGATGPGARWIKFLVQREPKVALKAISRSLPRREHKPFGSKPAQGFEDCVWLYSNSFFDRGLADLDYDEAAQLYVIARSCGSEPRMLQIGRDSGSTILLAVAGGAACKLTSVAGDRGHGEDLSHLLSELRLSDRVEQSASDATAIEPDSSCYDLVFVRGGNNALPTRPERWMRAVKPGGHLVFHGAIPNRPLALWDARIKRLVEELEQAAGEEFRRVEARGSLAVFQRQPESSARITQSATGRSWQPSPQARPRQALVAASDGRSPGKGLRDVIAYHGIRGLGRKWVRFIARNEPHLTLLAAREGRPRFAPAPPSTTPQAFEDCSFLFEPSFVTRGLIMQDLDEAAQLFQLVRATCPDGRPAAVFEIGRRWGGSTVLLAVASGDGGQVTSVDLEPGDDERLQALLQEIGVRDRVELITADANTVSRSEAAYDLVFIDGDHRYDGVRKDFERWAPAVRPGGFLVFHDAWPNRPLAMVAKDVERLIKEVESGDVPAAGLQLERIQAAGSLAVFRRVPVAAGIAQRPPTEIGAQR